METCPWHGLISQRMRILFPVTLDSRCTEAGNSSHSLQVLPYSCHLLLHNEEKCPPVAHAFGVKTWGQHIWVVDQGPWQQWDRRCEGAEDPDDVRVRSQLLRTSLRFSVSVKRDKCMRPVTGNKSWKDNLRPQ